MSKRIISAFLAALLAAASVSVVASAEETEINPSGAPEIKFKEVFAKNNSCTALSSDGGVYSWGGGSSADVDYSYLATPIKSLDNVSYLTEYGNSYYNSNYFAVTNDGVLYVWDSYNSNYSYRPEKKLENVASASVASDHGAAITYDGSLYAWGSNYYGQLGDGTTYSKTDPVKIMDDVASVSVISGFTAAVKNDGSLYTWGYNDNGMVGDGSNENTYTPTKVMDNVESVSVATYSIGAVTKDGSLYTWGQNNYGQLGDGTKEDRYTPKKILDNVSSVKLADYGTSTCSAITKDGGLYTWGYNYSGQVGNGTAGDPVLTPTKIMDKAASYIPGSYVSAVITKDGSLYTWGRNNFGQLGNGTTENGYKPTKVLDSVSSFVSGYNHSAAITKNGNLYVWGYNKFGQIGNGTIGGNVLTPTKVLNEVPSVSLGRAFSAAISKDGDIYTWGHGSAGQLGNGAIDRSENVPTKVDVTEQNAPFVSSFRLVNYKSMVLNDSYNSSYLYASLKISGPTGDNYDSLCKSEAEKIKWEFSEPGIAEIDSINIYEGNSGVSLSLNVLGKGTTVLTGTTSNGLTSSCIINVTEEDDEADPYVLALDSPNSGVGNTSTNTGDGINYTSNIYLSGGIRLAGKLDENDNKDILSSEIQNMTWEFTRPGVAEFEDVSLYENNMKYDSADYVIHLRAVSEGYTTLIGTTSNGLKAQWNIYVENFSESVKTDDKTSDIDTDTDTEEAVIKDFGLEEPKYKKKYGPGGVYKGISSVSVEGYFKIEGSLHNFNYSEISKIKWESSNPEVADISDENNYGMSVSVNSNETDKLWFDRYVSIFKEGTTTLTGTTSNGLTASCEIVIDKIYNQNSTDTDTDTYYDYTDVDTGTDSYADSDTATDSYTDSDTATDTYTDSDTATDINTDSDTETDTYTDSDTATDINTDSDIETDADSDTDNVSDTDTDSDTETDIDTDTDSDTGSDIDTDTDSDTDTDTEKYIIGDINSDGQINSADSILILRHAANLEKFDDIKKALADVNGDGSINTLDAVEILRYVAHINGDNNIGENL